MGGGKEGKERVTEGKMREGRRAGERMETGGRLKAKQDTPSYARVLHDSLKQYVGARYNVLETHRCVGGNGCRRDCLPPSSRRSVC